jgi:hypothetical protein
LAPGRVKTLRILIYSRLKGLEAVSKVARESFGSSLEKKVLYTILSERTPLILL